MITLKDVTEKEGEWSKLFTRMDNDRRLFYLDKYVLKDMRGNKLEEVHSVTLNAPKVFGERVISVLSETPLRWVVSGSQLTDKKASEIERAYDLILLTANRFLEDIGEPSIQVKMAEQLALRGRVGARCLIRMNKDEFLPDIKIVDMRYCVYDYDDRGLAWIAPRYTRNRFQLEQEYPDVVFKDSNKIVVRDIWTKDYNLTYADEVLIREVENPYGYIPFVVKVCNTGSFLDDEEALEYWGESIYSSDRDLYDEMNLLMSVMQTHNKISLYPPQKARLKANREITSHGYKMGGVTNLLEGEDIDTLSGLDINNSVRMAHSIVSRGIDQGSLPAVDYGNLSFTLSAVAIEKLTEPAKQVYIPRLKTMSSFYEQLGRMIARQYLEDKISTELGEEGYEERIDSKVFDQKYSLKADLHLKLPEQEIANYSMAINAGNLISEDTKRRDILKLQDPAEEEDRIRSEQAEQLSPTLMLYRRAKSLLSRAELTGDNQLKLEAKILLAEIGMTLEQVEKGEPTLKGRVPQAAPAPQPGASDIPLMGNKGGPEPPGSRESFTPGQGALEERSGV